MSRDHLIDLVIMTLQLPPFLDTSSAKRRSHLSKRNLKWELGEKPLNLMKETGEENRRTIRISQPYRKADESQRIMPLVKNLSIQLWETEEENRTRRSINEKPPNLTRKCERKTKRS